MTVNPLEYHRFIDTIKNSGHSIYDMIEVGEPNLWVPAPELEQLLKDTMKGLSLFGFPLRTRSKRVKEEICRALGYPIPARFKKTRPRFPGQDFDVYVQKSNNFQVWNERISPSRRYVIIRLDEDYIVSNVKVVNGGVLAMLNTTGTLTHKYQARLVRNDSEFELISSMDTNAIRPIVQSEIDLSTFHNPISQPQAGHLLSIDSLFDLLKPLVGRSFPDSGIDQERNRGAALHKLVCECLGFTDYQDSGQFPDVRHQLLEVKLQTSPTIDLGLVSPDSTEALDVSMLEGKQIRHCDVRYALLYAVTDGKKVTLTNLYLTTGEMFFTKFPKSQGKVLNKKLQITLPPTFFDE